MIISHRFLKLNLLTGNTKEILADLQSKMQSTLKIQVLKQLDKSIIILNQQKFRFKIKLLQIVPMQGIIGFTLIMIIYVSKYFYLDQVILQNVKWNIFNLYDTPEEILYSYLLQYYALNKLPKKYILMKLDVSHFLMQQIVKL